MLEITYPRHGAVLNRNHGHETSEALSIRVCGLCDTPEPVLVNGVVAERCGKQFSAELSLTAHENTITAATDGTCGRTVTEVKVIWDRKSFRRYHFFADDHSFFLTDLTRERPKRAFDHFYLAFWKRMHEQFGNKIVLNCFYRNDHDEKKWTMAEMPDCYRDEFADNADWLRLAFHAYSEFPDRPYQNVGGDKLAADYDLVRREIERFAGPATFAAPQVIHWGMCRASGLDALQKRGVKCLCGGFLDCSTGLEDSVSQEATSICDIGFFLNLPESQYLKSHRLWHDFRRGLTYCFDGTCFNLLPMEQLDATMHAVAEHPSQCDAIAIVTHEQYSFPYYFNYLPDHLQRIERGLAILRDHGYKSVNFNDGFLGNEG